jgi:hypothetical protein
LPLTSTETDFLLSRTPVSVRSKRQRHERSRDLFKQKDFLMTDAKTIICDGEELTRIADQNPDLGLTGWRNSDYTTQQFAEYRAGLFKAVDQYRAAKRFLHAALRCPTGKGHSS